MTNQPTPTWIYSQRRTPDNQPCVEVYDMDGRTVAVVMPYVDRVTGRHMTAEHARVIAQAPHMLALLKTMVPQLETCFRDRGYASDAIERATADLRAVIARAT